MGQCLAKGQDKGTPDTVKDIFPDYYSESRICDCYVDRLPARLLGEGIHLLRGGPGPIVCSWTHELLNDAGVHSYRDRELLLKTRDEIVAAVETHRQRLRQLHPCASTASASEPTGALKPPSGAESSRPESSSSAAATQPAEPPLDKAAAREAAVASVAAAAAAASDASANTTAFSSEGDGQPFRLTRDYLPSGPHLYRISEEMRHMASSVLGSDTSNHSRSNVALDVSVSVKDRATAVARSKSRLATVSSGVCPGDGDAGRDDDDGVGGGQDRDGDRDDGDGTLAATAAATSGDSDSSQDGGSPSGVAPPAAADGPMPASSKPHGADSTARPAVSAAAMPVGGSHHYRASGSGGGGSGGCEGSGGSSSSSGSTLGAESLAALTSLETTTTPPSPSPPDPSLLAAADGDVGLCAADVTCAVLSGSACGSAGVLRGPGEGCGADEPDTCRHSPEKRQCGGIPATAVEAERQQQREQEQLVEEV